jgi:hypothetical protein
MLLWIINNNIMFADIWKIEIAEQQLLGAKKMVIVNLLLIKNRIQIKFSYLILSYWRYKYLSIYR